MTGIIEKAHSVATRGFASYGVCATAASGLILCGGLALMMLLSVGIERIESENRIAELWTEKGTRLRPERDFFEEHFGGLMRKELIAVTSPSGAGITNADALGELRDLLESLWSDDSPDALNVSTTIGAGSTTNTLKIKDFCETPTVPPVFRPYAAGTLQWLSNQAFMSYGYRYMTQCLPTKDVSPHPLNGAPPNILPDGWGIDRFPCTRGVILDCFKEGNYDYPANLRLLDDEIGSTGLALADMVMGHPAKAQCLDDFETHITGVLSLAGQPAPVAAGTAAVLKSSLDSTISLFWTFGFRWRASFASMSPAQVAEHLDQAIKNSRNPAVQIPQCIMGGLPCCMSWNGRKTTEQIWLGDETMSGGNLTKAGASRVVINVFNHDHPAWVDKLEAIVGENTTSVEREALALQFESNYIHRMHQEQQSRNTQDVRFTFLADRSTNDVVEEGGEVETHLVVIGYVLMIVYAFLSLGNWVFPLTKASFLHSHMLLSLGAIATVGLSTVAGFGIVGIIGLTISPIAFSLVPVLSLALGMDDAWVLMHTMAKIVRDTELSRACSDESPESEKSSAVRSAMKASLAIAGPSVLLTSLANFAAFAIATATPIEAVQSFCWQLALQVVCNFVFLFVLFIPLMSFDLKRVVAGRMDVTLQKIPSADRQSIKKGSYVSDFAEKTMAPLLMKMPVKLGVSLLFVAGLAVLTWNGFDNTESGLRVSDIALRDTYQRDYIQIQESYFLAYDNFLVSRPSDFAAAQEGILNVQTALQNTPFVPESMRIRDLAWLADGSSSLLYTAMGAANSTTPIPAPAFDAAFQSWATTTGAIYSPDMSCRSTVTGNRVDCAVADADTELVATKQTVYFQNLGPHEVFVDTIEGSRAVVDSYNSDTNDNFLIGYIFMYWEQYLHIEDNLYEVVGWALLGTFAATLLMQFSIITSLLVVVAILSIILQVYGWMPIFDIKLNAFSVVNLCMLVGIAIESTAHIARAFLVAKGSRDERMKAALSEMLPPILNGTISSFLPILVLIGAKFPFFRRYYFGFFTLGLIVALVHGVILLPVLLSWVGPAPLKLDSEEQRLLDALHEHTKPSGSPQHADADADADGDANAAPDARPAEGGQSGQAAV